MGAAASEVGTAEAESEHSDDESSAEELPSSDSDEPSVPSAAALRSHGRG